MTYMTYDRDLLGNDIKKKLDLKEHPDQGVYVQSKCLQDTCGLFLTTDLCRHLASSQIPAVHFSYLMCRHLASSQILSEIAAFFS